MRSSVVLGLLTATLLAACSQAPGSQTSSAQTSGATGQAGQLPQGVNSGPLSAQALGPDNAAALDKSSKLGSALNSLRAGGRVGAQRARSQRAPNPERPGHSLLLGGDQVTVDAVASADPEALLARLQGLGLQRGSSYQGVVSGVLPVSKLGEVAALPELRAMRPASAATNAAPTPPRGAAVSQGDVAMRADVARQKYRVTGAGIKVGALSDSQNCFTTGLTTAAQDVASGELPATGVQVVEEQPEPDCSASGSDEGRAMLQLIHDVAPGSDLAFATAFTGQAGFANNIIRLADAGARVIVDDVSYFAEPMFQDGPIAQAVDTVALRGVSYFSSAGNSARQSYESGFRASGQTFNGCELHNFDPNGGTDTLQRITIAPGDDVLIAMQWDQPFASAVPGGKGSASDVDLLLFDDAGRLLPTDAAAGQFPVSADDNVGADPVEIVQYFNTTTAPINVNLAMILCAGPKPGLLKWVDFDYGTDVEYATNSPTSYGHANAIGAAGVGAARYTHTPAFGVNPPRLEAFSSAGGVPIFFTPNGTRIPNIPRFQPRFTAPDGTDTSFFIPGLFFPDTNAFPNFFGTSAAAPHAAAVAALLLEKGDKFGVRLPPAAVYLAMSKSAIDMNTPGYDADSGAGLIQADKTIGAIFPF